jgi:endonuclease/exonuclease/phosphatase family metal-dependent hydrolase
MKKVSQIIILIFTFSFLSAGTNEKFLKNRIKLPLIDSSNREAHIRIASYNIRYIADQDIESGNDWNKRKYHVANIIRDFSLEIVGTQEGDFSQMDDLLSLLPGYDYVGYPYGGSCGTLHTASILFKKSRFEVITRGRFWYSDTPDIESIGWDATDLRICTWARMKDKQNGIQFYFFTSHFYWRFQTAKENSGNVMVNKIKEIVIDDLPIVSTGDLNSSPKSQQIEDIKTILQNAYEVTESPRTGPEETYHGNFKYDLEDPGKILDYVFVNNKKVRVLTYNVLDYTYDDDRFPSDHLPVVCDLIIKR